MTAIRAPASQARWHGFEEERISWKKARQFFLMEIIVRDTNIVIGILETPFNAVKTAEERGEQQVSIGSIFYNSHGMTSDVKGNYITARVT
jgi:hypothetical protein